MSRYSRYHLLCRMAGSWVIAAVISWLGIAAACATDYRSIDDFQDVAVAVDRCVQQVGSDHVLLAVDVDNTLLTMNETLGSEQWFDWQVYLLRNEPHSPQLVARTFDGLLKVQGRLFDCGQMHPSQKETPSIIREIQGRGVAAIVLTSRGEEFRAATERELMRNGFQFARTALPVRCPTTATYLPYDPLQPAESGLTSEEIESLAPNAPSPVSYSHGIMMTAGQHKALMLISLLHRAEGKKIKAVVYTDNRPDHVAGVFAQLLQRGLKVVGLVYQREDDNVQAFKYGDKAAVSRRWKQMSHATIESVSGGPDRPTIRCKPSRRMGCCIGK